MKQYKLCKDCIHHQCHKTIGNSFYLRVKDCYFEVCNKSLTPTIRDHQEHCPHYDTNPNRRKPNLKTKQKKMKENPIHSFLYKEYRNQVTQINALQF